MKFYDLQMASYFSNGNKFLINSNRHSSSSSSSSSSRIKEEIEAS